MATGAQKAGSTGQETVGTPPLKEWITLKPLAREAGDGLAFALACAAYTAALTSVWVRGSIATAIGFLLFTRR